MYFRAGVDVASIDSSNWSREFGGVKYVDRSVSFNSLFDGAIGTVSGMVGFHYKLNF
jgi:hypothetical protein